MPTPNPDHEVLDVALGWLLFMSAAFIPWLTHHTRLAWLEARSWWQRRPAAPSGLGVPAGRRTPEPGITGAVRHR